MLSAPVSAAIQPVVPSGLRSSLYWEASGAEFQLRVTLSSSDDVTLRPLGAGAPRHAEVVLDTVEDVFPKVVE